MARATRTAGCMKGRAEREGAQAVCERNKGGRGGRNCARGREDKRNERAPRKRRLCHPRARVRILFRHGRVGWSLVNPRRPAFGANICLGAARSPRLLWLAARTRPSSSTPTYIHISDTHESEMCVCVRGCSVYPNSAPREHQTKPAFPSCRWW